MRYTAVEALYRMHLDEADRLNELYNFPVLFPHHLEGRARMQAEACRVVMRSLENAHQGHPYRSDRGYLLE